MNGPPFPGLPAWVGAALQVAGGAVVFILYRREAARRGFATEGGIVVAAAALVGGIFGALLLHSLAGLLGLREPWESADGWRRVLLLVGSGRSWIGALVGGYAVVEWTKRRIGLRRRTGDAWALALPLGEAVGRLGCLAAGCCYGSPASVPWAVTQHGDLRHPAQLYAAALALVLWLVLRALDGRLPREGDLFKVYLAGYAVTRFGLEFFRDHNGAAGLSTAQWACLAGLGWVAWSLRSRSGASPLAVPARSDARVRES